MHMLEKRADFGNGSKAAPEQHRHDRYRSPPGICLQIRERSERAVAVAKREGMERFVLPHRVIGNAVHAVDISERARHLSLRRGQT